MDERKPSIPPSEFHLRSAFEWTSADIDPPPAELARSGEFVALERRQSRSGQIEPCRNDFSNEPSVAAYCRNEWKVSEGFLTALSAMVIARVEQLRAGKPPVRGAKPFALYHPFSARDVYVELFVATDRTQELNDILCSRPQPAALSVRKSRPPKES